MFLLDRLLIGAPIAGFKFVLRTIATVADAELADDEEKVMADIRSLHQRFEAGELSDTEFREQETPLMERWRALRRRALGLE
ncbi:MAG TPA: gas vesicle protein GvpG [Candidatus Dormibacteraeota bacterium]|jgi:hypothetical protein|nr:gas vesicle protein GvpG [Candidatus Dormibacteraeota bacterium]